MEISALSPIGKKALPFDEISACQFPVIFGKDGQNSGVTPEIILSYQRHGAGNRIYRAFGIGC